VLCGVTRDVGICGQKECYTNVLRCFIYAVISSAVKAPKKGKKCVTLNCVSNRLKDAKSNSGEPFGGVDMIFAGDFY
jgi:hypothetical protein